MSSVPGQISELHLVGVALGAGAGAVCRAAVDRTVFARVGPTRLPWATLIVNVLGSLVLGFVLAMDVLALPGASPAEAAEAATTLRLAVGTGFAGGLTTFSTFTWESWHLLREGRGRAGLLYAGLTMGLGMAAITLGSLLGHALG